VEFPRVVRQAFLARSDFAKYLRRAMPGNAPRIPPIDWARREAILVAAGPRSSTGYDLRVVDVHETSDRLVVAVRERTPSLGEPVEARVTYPFRLITIPRSSKRLFLHWEGRP
jgi:PrcB C-terminal